MEERTRISLSIYLIILYLKLDSHLSISSPRYFQKAYKTSSMNPGLLSTGLPFQPPCLNPPALQVYTYLSLLWPVSRVYDLGALDLLYHSIMQVYLQTLVWIPLIVGQTFVYQPYSSLYLPILTLIRPRQDQFTPRKRITPYDPDFRDDRRYDFLKRYSLLSEIRVEKCGKASREIGKLSWTTWPCQSASVDATQETSTSCFD